MPNETEEPDLVVMLNIIRNAIDNTHLILKYVAETVKAGKSLDYAMPAIENHVRGLDRLSGEASLQAAVEMVRLSVEHANGEHNDH